MKKLLSLLLVGAMTLSLVACGAKEEVVTEEATTEEATTEETAELEVLRVGMECGYAPYNWTQADDSNGAVPIADSSDYANGYDVMMAKYLADEMGVELEIYKIDWDSLPVAVQSGAIDAVIAGQSITAERLETVDFTTPYYYASVVALTRGDTDYAAATSVADLEGATASSQINTIWYDVALPQIPSVNALPAMESAPAMIVALQSGAIDVVVTDMPTATAATVADPSLKVLAFEGEAGFEVSDEDVNIGISTKKGNTALVEGLNAGLAKLTEEDFIAMMDDAIAVQPLSE